MEGLGRSWRQTTAVLVGGLTLLAGAAYAAEPGRLDLHEVKTAEIQQLVENENKSGVFEQISVYGTNNKGYTLLIGSFDPSILDKVAEPEEVAAITNDKVVTKNEGEILAVTIPLHNAEGQPAAVAELRLKITESRDKNASQKVAEEFAKKIGAALTK